MGIRDILRKTKEAIRQNDAADRAKRIAKYSIKKAVVSVSKGSDKIANAGANIAHDVSNAYQERKNERVQKKYLKEATQEVIYGERLTQIPQLAKERVHAETEEQIKGFRETAKRGRSGQRTGVSGFLFNAPTSNPFSSDIPKEVAPRSHKKSKKGKHRTQETPRNTSVNGSGLFSDNPFREVHDKPRRSRTKRHKKSKDIVIKVR